MKYTLLLTILLTSCSAFKPENEVAENSNELSSNSREIASFSQSSFSCKEALRLIRQKSGVLAAEKKFSEETIRTYVLRSTSFTDQINDVIRSGMYSRKVNKILSSLSDKFKSSTENARTFKSLNIYEKKILHYLFIEKIEAKVEGVALLDLAHSGDQLSKYLLTIPEGELRENTLDAIRVAKRMNPEYSIDDLIAVVEKNMKACAHR